MDFGTPDRDQPSVNKIVVIAEWIRTPNMYVVEEIEIYVRPMFIQNPRGVALHSILIQDTMLIQNSRGIALHSIFKKGYYAHTELTGCCTA